MCGAKEVLTAKEQSPIFAKIDLAYLKKRVKELHVFRRFGFFWRENAGTVRIEGHALKYS